MFQSCRSPSPFDACAYGGGNFSSGVHNSLAYFGYVRHRNTLDPKHTLIHAIQLDKSNPADLYTIGGRGADGHQVFQDLEGLGYFPLASGESAATVIWPGK